MGCILYVWHAMVWMVQVKTGPTCGGVLLSSVSVSLAVIHLSLAGHLEESLASALRTYAPPYEADTDAEEAQEPPGAAPVEAPRTAAERHAELTQRAEHLLRGEGPTATDMRMYNMMLTRETIAQASSASHVCLLRRTSI